MLSERTELILKSIVNWYIARAVPVSSQNLVQDFGMDVSSATVRHEMADLERNGYIIRPHTSAGSIPSDKGYRYFVASLNETTLPLAEQRMINHLFHQVESRMDEWLSLGATVLSRLSRNTAVVTGPKPTDSRFRHLELVSLSEKSALLIVVMRGAHIKQRLITLENALSQENLSAMADALNRVYLGMTAEEIERRAIKSNPEEERITKEVVEIMKGEDTRDYDKSYLEGLHFMLHQPEFSRNERILDIMELLEHRTMLGSILPADSGEEEVRVVIGSENKAEVARECSLVIGHYGVAGEVKGTLVVVGPTRMAYPRVIATVSHLSALLSGLIAELYGFNCQGNSQRNLN